MSRSPDPSTSETAPVGPAVVLVRTQEEGNLGSTARAMANMGLDRLILVAPRIEIGSTARAFAVGAGHVLDATEWHESLPEALAPFQRVVGTTSARGRTESPLAPRLLPRVLDNDPQGTSTCLVFGPEASGLTADELALAHPVVRIPCSPRQPTLNLAQAVLVVAYELYSARLAGSESAVTGSEGEDALATFDQIDGLFTHAEGVLREVGFARDDTFESVLRDLRRMAARASLGEREVAILRGICRRASHRLGR